jgi:hypothetical protein
MMLPYISLVQRPRKVVATKGNLVRYTTNGAAKRLKKDPKL